MFVLRVRVREIAAQGIQLWKSFVLNGRHRGQQTQNSGERNSRPSAETMALARQNTAADQGPCRVEPRPATRPESAGWTWSSVA